MSQSDSESNSDNTSNIPPNAGRLRSIDALRGFDMLWIVGAGAIVKALDKTNDSAVTTFLSTQLRHVKWEGFRFYDLIFPLFLFIVGISIVFSLDKAFDSGGRAAVMGRVVRRGLLLFALAIFYYGGLSQPWPNVQLGGVLHRIAACYVLAALIYTFVRKPKGLAIAAAVLLVGYWAVLTFVPIPDLLLQKEVVEAAAESVGSDSPFAIAAATEGQVCGLYTEGRNLTNFIDFLILPGKKANLYYINEGLLSTLPATALSLFGILAGMLLKNASVSPTGKLVRLLSFGAVGIVIGLLWSLQFPLIKRIWTSSFILVAGGLSAWMLALFYYIVDVRKWHLWCEPFVWIGCNALVVYIAARIVPFQKLATYFVGGDVEIFINKHTTEGFGGVAIAGVSLLLVVLFARFLYRRKIFIRV
ncbi:MAG: heparan-alpha-glucosaminide N-acetyltransferase domain-containing protein [Fuerstiella sp.]